MTGTILGIHSNVAGAESGYIDGHAWLTIYRDGRTTTYGLYPDSHETVVANGENNGNGSDVRRNYEASYVAVASRYYRLSAPQSAQFDSLVRNNAHWRFTNNCSSWASSIVRALVREDVDADDNFGFETPRELGRNILRLEARSPTTLLNPRPARNEPASSSLRSRSSR